MRVLKTPDCTVPADYIPFQLIKAYCIPGIETDRKRTGKGPVKRSVILNPPKGTSYTKAAPTEAQFAAAALLKLPSASSSPVTVGAPGTSQITVAQLPSSDVELLGDTCVNCEKIQKVRGDFRRHGKCENLECNMYWCLVSDCKFEALTVPIVTRHIIMKHPNTPLDPKECSHCYQRVKNRSKKDESTCQVCAKAGKKVFWCLEENCHTECMNNKRYLDRHLANKHNKLRRLNEPFLCAGCGHSKPRGTAVRYMKCPNPTCTLYWCMFKRCVSENTDLKKMKAHSAHKKEPLIDLTMCLCGKSQKVRPPNETKGGCESCKCFWCLKDKDCNMEFGKEEELDAHITNAHKE